MPAMEKPALVYALYSFFVTFAVGYLLVLIREKVLKKVSTSTKMAAGTKELMGRFCANRSLISVAEM